MPASANVRRTWSRLATRTTARWCTPRLPGGLDDEGSPLRIEQRPVGRDQVPSRRSTARGEGAWPQGPRPARCRACCWSRRTRARGARAGAGRGPAVSRSRQARSSGRRHDRAGVPERAEVLPRVEAEAPGHAEGPGTSGPPGRSMCLRGVLDQQEAEVRGQGSQGAHVRHLPVEVDHDHGLGRGVTAASTTLRRDEQRVIVDISEAGAAPARTTPSAVATNVLAGTTTSSPGPTPRARSVRWRASVPFAMPTAWPCRSMPRGPARSVLRAPLR